MKLKNTTHIVAGFAASLIATGTANAKPYVDKVLVHNGYNAGQTRRSEGRDRALDQVYPGSEQSVAVQMASGRIMVVSMSSYTDVPDFNGETLNNVTAVRAGSNVTADGTNTRMQMLCAPVDITASGVVVGTPVHVTNREGDKYRNANHPTAFAAFGGTALVTLYNYADNGNNQAEREVLVLGENCERLSTETQVFGNAQANNNNNGNDNFCETDGMNSVAVISETADKVIFAEGCGGNGNNSDDSWVYTASVTKTGDTYTAAYLDHARLTNQEERSRPSSVVMSDLSTPTSAFLVNSYTKGNTQPPNQGVWIMGSNVDKTTGQITPAFNQLIEEYDDIMPGVLSTQIRMTPVTLTKTGSMLASKSDATGDFLYTTWQRVDAQRRRGKGKAALMGATVRITSSSADLLALPQAQLYADGDATHMHMSTVMMGQAGSESPKAFLMSTSVNGSQSSLSTAKTLAFNAGSNSLTTERKYNLNAAIDNAWLSNIYGNNPNTQGRNFVNASGSVMNPHYGQAVGYQTDVQQFIVMAANTRRTDPETMQPEDKLALEVVLVPSVVAPGAEEVGVPDSGSAGGSGGDIAGGCSTSQGFGGLLLLGLAILGIRRRRVVA
jgi:hypothetical protein